MFVLGIDAGGSKTVCLLADGDGEVRRSARGPGANLAVLGELEVEKVLYELMEQVLTDEETASLEQRAAKNRIDRPPRLGDTGAFNQFWIDRGTKVVPTKQSSLIVDPLDGKLPNCVDAILDRCAHDEDGGLQQ